MKWSEAKRAGPHLSCECSNCHRTIKVDLKRISMPEHLDCEEAVKLLRCKECGSAAIRILELAE